MKKIAMAITGASGAIYAIGLLEKLLEYKIELHLVLSDAASVVFATELDIKLPKETTKRQEFFCKKFNVDAQKLNVYHNKDWFSPIASGSANLDAMLIVPASSGSLSAIANGASNNLIERGADVFLKERRKLILLTRETPLNQIHLENMLKITQMGGIVMPASPGFYNKPTKINQLVDFIIARILTQLGLEQNLLPEWGSRQS